MAGNIGLQILRGSKEFDPLTSSEILKDGQLFYSKKNEQLYIGDGVNQLKDLEGTTIGLNLKNSAGANSLQLKPAENSFSYTSNGIKYENIPVETTGKESLNLSSLSRVDRNHYLNVGNLNTIEDDPVTNPNEDDDGGLIVGYKNYTNARASGLFGAHNRLSTGKNTYMFGYSNIASGNNNFIVGSANRNTDLQPITGEMVTVIGMQNQGYAHTKEGVDFNERKLYNSTTIGFNNINRGKYNQVIGIRNEIGDTDYCPQACNVIGSGLYAHYNGQILLGTYNEKGKWVDFAVGNGRNDNERHNSFDIARYNGRARSYVTEDGLKAAPNDNDILIRKEINTLLTEKTTEINNTTDSKIAAAKTDYYTKNEIQGTYLTKSSITYDPSTGVLTIRTI